MISEKVSVYFGWRSLACVKFLSFHGNRNTASRLSMYYYYYYYTTTTTTTSTTTFITTTTITSTTTTTFFFSWRYNPPLGLYFTAL